MKYVGIDVGHGNLTKRLVVVFPDDFVHKDVAEALKTVARKSWPKSHVSTGSGGFIGVVAGDTYGKSESLGLTADKDDARKFNFADYGGNYL